MIVYVLDTETTGLRGGPTDLVVDIGVSKVDFDRRKVEPVYSSIVGYTEDEMRGKENSWIFQNTDLTVDDVLGAPPFEEVRTAVLDAVRGKNLTTYNTSFDLDKFLYRSPWNMFGTFRRVSDPMIAATKVCEIPYLYHPGEYKWPKLEEAYEVLCCGDPAGIGGVQDHRALSDTAVAGYCMLSMYAEGQYAPRLILEAYA